MYRAFFTPRIVTIRSLRAPLVPANWMVPAPTNTQVKLLGPLSNAILIAVATDSS